jgi:glucosamine--fructose-6-phosphate aminotransferase (isomerizing)
MSLISAGAERSVAATKSFIAQLVAGLRLHAGWMGDDVLQQAMLTLPQTLRAALLVDWSAAVASLRNVDRLYVIGRGRRPFHRRRDGAQIQEVCGIRAEAFSSAEVRHGPMALVNAGYPVLVLAPRGVEQRGLHELASELHDRGAEVQCVVAGDAETPKLPLLPTVTAAHDASTRCR